MEFNYGQMGLRDALVYCNYVTCLSNTTIEESPLGKLFLEQATKDRSLAKSLILCPWEMCYIPAIAYMLDMDIGLDHLFPSVPRLLDREKVLIKTCCLFSRPFLTRDLYKIHCDNHHRQGMGHMKLFRNHASSSNMHRVNKR